MSYLTIGYTDYMVRAGEGRGRVIDVQRESTAVDGSILVDPIRQRIEFTRTITGEVDAGRFFTPEEAMDLVAELRSGPVEVGGVEGEMTMRARDISWTDGQDWSTSPPTVYRWVTATLYEV